MMLRTIINHAVSKHNTTTCSVGHRIRAFKGQQRRTKSTHPFSSTVNDEANQNPIFQQARENAATFDQEHNLQFESMLIPHCVRTLVRPIRPVFKNNIKPTTLKSVPTFIPRPPYARTGEVPNPPHYIIINEKEQIDDIRNSARLARDVLDLACNSAKEGMTSNDIDDIVHDAIVEAGAYPSPLNYSRFPKSVCSSINEVICHGIPDDRPMVKGDLASFDVSCFLNGFHGKLATNSAAATLAIRTCSRSRLHSTLIESERTKCLIYGVFNYVSDVISCHNFLRG